MKVPKIIQSMGVHLSIPKKEGTLLEPLTKVANRRRK
jgi:hypothetical protein